jgi:hypothetical protein
MGIVEGPTRVRFVDRGVVFFGLLFILIGVGVHLHQAASWVALECDRDAGRCSLTENGLWGAETLRVAPEALRGARLDRQVTTSDEGVRRERFRAVLDTAEGSRWLSAARTNDRAQHQALVAAVDAFIAGERRRLSLRHGGMDGWTLALSATFAGVGLLMLFGVRNVVEARVAGDVLVLRRRRWWQSGGRQEFIPLASIVATEVVGSRADGGSRTHRLQLRLEEGRTVALFGYASSGQGAFRRQRALDALLRRAGVAAVTD